MLATIITTNLTVAQIMFIGAFVFAAWIVGAFITKKLGEFFPLLVAIVLAFLAAGLFFAP